MEGDDERMRGDGWEKCEVEAVGSDREEGRSSSCVASSQPHLWVLVRHPRRLRPGFPSHPLCSSRKLARLLPIIDRRDVKGQRCEALIGGGWFQDTVLFPGPSLLGETGREARTRKDPDFSDVTDAARVLVPDYVPDLHARSQISESASLNI